MAAAVVGGAAGSQERARLTRGVPAVLPDGGSGDAGAALALFPDAGWPAGGGSAAATAAGHGAGGGRTGACRSDRLHGGPFPGCCDTGNCRRCAVARTCNARCSGQRNSDDRGTGPSARQVARPPAFVRHCPALMPRGQVTVAQCWNPVPLSERRTGGVGIAHEAGKTAPDGVEAGMHQPPAGAGLQADVAVAGPVRRCALGGSRFMAAQCRRRR